MPGRVQVMVRTWNARAAIGGTGHLPMQFDLDASLNSGVVETEVEAERTSGTRHRYDQKKVRYGGVIPYYTFDRLILYNQPNQPIVLTAVVRGNLPATIPAQDALAFVIMSSGEFRVAPPLGVTRLNHAHIADMATDVLYAGTIGFGIGGNKRGLLNFWNNDSGAYRCPQNAATVAGLPMERYDAPRWPSALGQPGPAPVYA